MTVLEHELARHRLAREPVDVVGRRPGLIPTAMSRRVFETDLLANQLDLPLYNFPSRLLVGGLALLRRRRGRIFEGGQK